MQGPAILQNHIIVNINENKNINNFYNIQGRKIDEQQHIIRMGREDKDTESQDLLKRFSAEIENPSSKNNKTMISKKLLSKAKQASKKQANRAQQAKKEANKTAAAPLAGYNLAPSSYQTARHDRKKLKSQQFDIPVGLARGKDGISNNVTLDYEHRGSVGLNQSSSGVRSALLGLKGHEMSSRRKSAHSNTTQGKSTLG